MGATVEYPIIREAKAGLDCLRVEVSIEIETGAGWSRPSMFVFDTGAEVSMVSEDVADRLRFPGGGRTITVSGSTARGVGRIVPVRFRFAAQPDLHIDSEWMVMPGVTDLRLLALRDVLPHFEIRTLNTFLYFLRK
jgi:hypothetical protein